MGEPSRLSMQASVPVLSQNYGEGTRGSEPEKTGDTTGQDLVGLRWFEDRSQAMSQRLRWLLKLRMSGKQTEGSRRNCHPNL